MNDGCPGKSSVVEVVNTVAPRVLDVEPVVATDGWVLVGAVPGGEGEDPQAPRRSEPRKNRAAATIPSFFREKDTVAASGSEQLDDRSLDAVSLLSFPGRLASRPIGHAHRASSPRVPGRASQVGQGLS